MLKIVENCDGKICNASSFSAPSMVHHRLENPLQGLSPTHMSFIYLYFCLMDELHLANEMDHTPFSRFVFGYKVLLSVLFLFTYVLPIVGISSSSSSSLEGNYFSYPELKDRSIDKYGADANSAIVLGLLEELFTLKVGEWYARDESSGYYIKSASQLENRLQLTRRTHNWDCRRDHSLLFMCLITKNDGSDLQEWLMHQIVVFGAHHILVYVNDPEGDNTWIVLKPFIDAGYVTAFNFTGTARQREVYPNCIDIIRKKSCEFDGKPLPVMGGNNDEKLKSSLSPFMALRDCKLGEDFDMFRNVSRPVWVAGFDGDEFPIDSSHLCLIDALPKYETMNGLLLPWFVVGPSGRFLTPKSLLVSESYDRRRTHVGGLDKVISRVSAVSSMLTSHGATYVNKKGCVDENFKETHHRTLKTRHILISEVAHNESEWPKFRLYHYLTKSIEHLMKKWVRGVADETDPSNSNRAKKRPLSDIVGWLERNSTFDNSMKPYSKIVRSALFGN